MQSPITRRNFLKISSISLAGFVAGCAINPVSGKSQFMLLSESKEIQIDKQNSGHQFSSDYGISQDAHLNNYINSTGKRIAGLTHRPDMPFSFRCVNAVYVNAYAFPGGTIAATRGILLKLENEAQLASLLGHELGHVNARHTAQIMSKSFLANAFLSGITTYIGVKSASYARLASQLGMIGAGALLASYSRDNEREADSLGLNYMVKAGYNPKGFEELMLMLNKMNKNKSNAFELLFATHPMSRERYNNAIEKIKTDYSYAISYPFYRERYMDNTSRLRAIKDAIEEMQNGEKEMANQKYIDAKNHFEKALKQAPNDYAGLVMMSKCFIMQKKYNQAMKYAKKANQVYPEEAQAHHLLGYINIKLEDFDNAFAAFSKYETMLPGNPNTIFFKGYCLDKMGHTDKAAQEYIRYLKIVNQGDKAKYAYQRLVKWKYINQDSR